MDPSDPTMIGRENNELKSTASLLRAFFVFQNMIDLPG
jgi:hypothetical protein